VVPAERARVETGMPEVGTAAFEVRLLVRHPACAASGAWVVARLGASWEMRAVEASENRVVPLPVVRAAASPLAFREGRIDLVPCAARSWR
jgi:hypothetical protein